MGDFINDDILLGWVVFLCWCFCIFKDFDYCFEKILKRFGFCDNFNRLKFGMLYLYFVCYVIISKMNYCLRDVILIVKFYVRDRFLILYSGCSLGLGYELFCEFCWCCIVYFFVNKCIEIEIWREFLMWNMVINSIVKLLI